MRSTAIDYSIYLVTGRNLLPPGKDYLESLEESLQGGVTVVQIREKDADTAEFIEIAKQSKTICDKYNIPILINDRIDIALAINANGVHLGQTDMSVTQARSLLPKGSIIGVSCNNAQQVEKAIKDEVDYIGIGAVWGTKTKKLSNPIIGVRGVGEMLEVLDGKEVKAVAIGGINSKNLLRTLHGTVSSTGHSLDGIAVVSDIVASHTPKEATEKLAGIFNAFKSEGALTSRCLPRQTTTTTAPTIEKILKTVTELMIKIRELGPLVHQITNHVVATQSANITLALGASPIMATEPREMEDLQRICGGLLVNIGTLTSLSVEGMRNAGLYANAFRKPIVFDPVGVGASAFRKEIVNDLLNLFQATAIKGNAGELATLAGSLEVESKGVDSVGSGFKDPVSVVTKLSRKERSIVVLTGPTDYISDGETVVALKNGDEILGKITGSGCVLGSTIAAYCATASSMTMNSKDGSPEKQRGVLVNGDMFSAAIAGVLVMTVAAEIVVESGVIRGPGTFLGSLIDVLWSLKPEEVIKRAKIEILSS